MNPIELKTLIETILGVKRNSQGLPTDYGLMGKYIYRGGFTNTAFSVGITPDIEAVTGLEIILQYPQSKQIMPLATGDIYSQKCYRLSLIQRSENQGHNAVMLLERSGSLQCLSYIFIQTNPEIGNYPQWNLSFKVHEFREKIESYDY